MNNNTDTNLTFILDCARALAVEVAAHDLFEPGEYERAAEEFGDWYAAHALFAALTAATGSALSGRRLDGTGPTAAPPSAAADRAEHARRRRAARRHREGAARYPGRVDRAHPTHVDRLHRHQDPGSARLFRKHSDPS